jgi:nicotinamide mononucleotide (NMN) deamidase PncC
MAQRFALTRLRSPRPIAHMLTAIARASDVVDRRFVTYAREAKSKMLVSRLT